MADQGGVDLEGVAVQADGGDLGDRAGLGPQERLVQQFWSGQPGWRPGQQPFEGRLAGLAVGPAVIDGLDPGGEQPVEFGQIGGASGFDLDEELDAYGGEEPFDFAAPLGSSGSAVDQADTQGGHGPQQLGADKRGPVGDVDGAGDPS